MTPYDTPHDFGSHVYVTIKMTYHPSMIGRFVEMPKLQWKEKFIVIEHHLQQRWTFEADMYRHNPSSKSLLIWRQRYFAAYDAAHGVPSSGLGSSRLLDKAGQPVQASKLGTVHANDVRAKTTAVQDYLKRNGGTLLISLHDRPSFRAPRQVAHGNQQVWQDKERLLLFHCGVSGGRQFFNGMQYLHVNGAQPMLTWERSEQTSWLTPDLTLPRGYTDVPVPPEYSTPRFAAPFMGEVD